MNTKMMVLALGLNLMFPFATFAATYYVAPGGKDTYTCPQAQNPAMPKATIQSALDCATAAGSTVEVQAAKPGGTVTYPATALKFAANGAPGNPVTLRARAGDTVKLKTTITDPASDTPVIELLDRSYIKITGLTFEGNRSAHVIRVRRGSPNSKCDKRVDPVVGIEIIGNRFIDNGHCGMSNCSGTITTWNNVQTVMMQCTGDTATSHQPQNFITDNIFTGNYGFNIYLTAATRTEIARNTITRSHYVPNSTSRFVNHPIKLGGELTGVNKVTYNNKYNIIHSNTVSGIVVDSYVGSRAAGAVGIKCDVNGDLNKIYRNLVFDIDRAGTKDGYGIMLESRCDNNEVYENVIHSVGKAGLHIGTTSTTTAVGNKLINNVAEGGLCGLVLSNAKGTTVQNNIFSSNRKVQAYVNDMSVANGGNVFSNNLYYHPTSTALNTWNGSKSCTSGATQTFSAWVAASREKNALNKDPKFVNPPADFRLQATSPAIDAGLAGMDLGAYPSATLPPLQLSAPTRFRTIQ